MGTRSISVPHAPLAQCPADGGVTADKLSPRMAIVHEWIAVYGGAEQVFEAMAMAFPDADLLALTAEPTVTLQTAGRTIETTVLDRPALRRRRNLTLPMMPVAWRMLGKARYDVVLTSHHAFAHSHRLAAGGIHLAYVHSPARYVWTPEIDGRGASAVYAPARAALRMIDRSVSRHVTAYAANSTAVARRIQDAWDRDATVIYPPVRVEYFGEPTLETPQRDYVLGVGRWIPYKNLHLVIEAASIAGIPAKIVGAGPEKPRLIAAAAAASVPVELLESPPDDVLRDLYRNAACLVFPTVEDFGLVPVEAQAAGAPVVAVGAGGALDTVDCGRSGILTSSAQPSELAAAIVEAASLAGEAPRANAARFSTAAFHTALRGWVRDQSA